MSWIWNSILFSLWTFCFWQDQPQPQLRFGQAIYWCQVDNIMGVLYFFVDIKHPQAAELYRTRISGLEILDAVFNFMLIMFDFFDVFWFLGSILPQYMALCVRSFRLFCFVCFLKKNVCLNDQTHIAWFTLHSFLLIRRAR